jgi:hypothetical protein
MRGSVLFGGIVRRDLQNIIPAAGRPPEFTRPPGPGGVDDRLSSSVKRLEGAMAGREGDGLSTLL